MAHESDPARVPQRQPYVLVVDDNPTNLELAVFTLEVAGFEVGTASDAAEYRRVLAARRPDAVLMDVQLPGSSGLELARELKADPATAAIPVIAVTAYAMKGDEQRMRAAGCDAYLSKPLDVATFAQRVKDVLRR
ncbi:MAG: response regulator [Burkholderiales bacterium]|nr:response regulator [Burkholderiales bacterium]